MYEPNRKKIGLDSKYGINLKAIFNNAEYMEHQYGEISTWTTQQYAEYAAKFRILTFKGLSTFKSIVKYYVEISGEDTAEIVDLNIDTVYEAVKRLKIPVFWKDARTCASTVRHSLETAETRELGVFVCDSVTSASILLYCGLEYDEIMKLKRDSVLRNGIWSYDFPTPIARNSVESRIIMDYARVNRLGLEEQEVGLPLIRGSRAGTKPLEERMYLYWMKVSNGFNPDVAAPSYDVTPQNVVLSGEFARLYKNIGNNVPLDETIGHIKTSRNYVKPQVKDLKYLYKLYCMLL